MQEDHTPIEVSTGWFGITLSLLLILAGLWAIDIIHTLRTVIAIAFFVGLFQIIPRIGDAFIRRGLRAGMLIVIGIIAYSSYQGAINPCEEFTKLKSTTGEFTIKTELVELHCPDPKAEKPGGFTSPLPHADFPSLPPWVWVGIFLTAGIIGGVVYTSSTGNERAQKTIFRLGIYVAIMIGILWLSFQGFVLLFYAFAKMNVWQILFWSVYIIYTALKILGIRSNNYARRIVWLAMLFAAGYFIHAPILGDANPLFALIDYIVRAFKNFPWGTFIS
ncbi:MAG: hypothetical protein G01um101433_50 [Parcubacteria group bacterium Gr01-1014_33]|nr:MAG: hypothetical protein G01um101433_50 [Parcubacteria group bacterium Gr01-1014_33]